jgi:hypothetical protein
MKKTKEKPAKFNYVFDAHITGIEPGIWRRIEIGRENRLSTLAAVIMTVFDWSGLHLHDFRIGGKEYGVPDPDFHDHETIEERKIRISDLNLRDLKRFDFTYDFGDNWDHEIRLVDVKPAESGDNLPKCLDGARAAPPEDCGSVPGYEDIICALGKKPGDRNDEEKAKIEWLPSWWKPEGFDPVACTRELRNIKSIEKQFNVYRKMMDM